MKHFKNMTLLTRNSPDLDLHVHDCELNLIMHLELKYGTETKAEQTELH